MWWKLLLPKPKEFPRLLVPDKLSSVSFWFGDPISFSLSPGEMVKIWFGLITLCTLKSCPRVW